ncbi:MAG TPA: VWA domain-containing protein [Bryobacteraceae bacterium]|nr:VWA domain-containing protein [Bryobacteraceae bacterium]
MRVWIIALFCVAAIAAALAGAGSAQDQQGPIRNTETVAKKKSTAAPDTAPDSDLPKIPSAYKKDKIDTGNLANFKTEVDTVTVDVSVLDGKGHFIPGIPKGAFRILEDNVPQQIQGYNVGEAPMTVAMVIEFSNRFQRLWGPVWYQTLELAWGFASTLRPEDYVAIVAYDIKPEILSDFTTDRVQTQEALHRLTIPAWSEANLFDAVTDTADRMSAIEGRKAIVLLSSGIDTFSKLTFDKTRKILQEDGVPIYAIGLMQTLRILMESYGMMGSIAQMDFLQADNQMRTFASETGGQAFFPRFEGEFGGIFQQIHQALRNQYVLTYSPSNKAHDGTYRKIKVQLVDSNGNPLPVKDEKGKPVKYSILAKSGYKAPRAVE